MSDFEVLMVSIDWESPDKIRAIVPSKRNIETSKISEKKIKEKELTEYKYEADIVLYHKEDGLYFQFAIKSKFTPYLKSNDNTWNQLFNVKDDLWINKGEWKKGVKGIGYHHCQSINTPGKIEIGLGDAQKNRYFISIDVNNNIEDFDFEQLKSDFEGELWELITTKKSKVSIDKSNYNFGNRIIRFPENKLIVDFLKSFEQIKNKPKHELSSSSENRKIEKVIPISETYRKISTSGLSKILPSKAVSENYDVYENRAVCAMLMKIYYIINNNTKNTSRQIDKLQRDVEIHLEKIKTLQDPDPKVNIENVKLEIEFQKEKIALSTNKWSAINKNLIPTPNVNYSAVVVTLTSSYQLNSFWCSTSFSQWCILVFPEEVVGYLELKSCYHFEVLYNKTGDFEAKSKKKYPIFTITHLKQIETHELIQERAILNKQELNLNIFAANNYSQKSIMTVLEVNKFETERKEQITTLNKKVSQLQSKINSIQDFTNEQIAFVPKIEQQIKSDFFSKIKWHIFFGFKPSMTFIQNTNYRNALRYYNDILKSEGIDIVIFDLYENITSYGIREMPQVYELWCLITLIRILENNFNFIVAKEDLNTLLKKIDPKNQKVDSYMNFKFQHNLAGREIILHYQKTLADGKRPDFIIEITHGTRNIQLILDSKFKNYNYKQTIVYESLAMFEKYSNNRDNYVFVLHPCKDGVFENRKVKYTNHGGERFYFNSNNENNQVFPFHKYGFVECKPNTTDALKKLIGMGFEYLLESNKNAKTDKLIDPKPEFPLFCISCGKEDVNIKTNSRGENRFYHICNCNNPECGLVSHIDYCWNCKSKLFKHGSFWDYHLESIYNVMDIRCPNCGMTMADRPK